MTDLPKSIAEKGFSKRVETAGGFARYSSQVNPQSGKPLAKAVGVKFLRMDGDRAVLEVEAGSYKFATTAK